MEDKSQISNRDISIGILPLEIKGFNEEGIIEGMASTPDVDHIGDVVFPNAFSESIEKKGKENIKFLNNHESHKIIGEHIELKPTPEGLYFKSKFDFEGNNKEYAKEAFFQLKRSEFKGVSFGYRIIDQKIVGGASSQVKRLIKKVDLHEISLVHEPCNANAKIIGYKSIDKLSKMISEKYPNIDIEKGANEILAECDTLEQLEIMAEEIGISRKSRRSLLEAVNKIIEKKILTKNMINENNIISQPNSVPSFGSAVDVSSQLQYNEELNNLHIALTEFNKNNI